MIRGTTVIWALLSIFAGVSMFVLKHQVRSLEGDLQQLERAIVAEQEAIHVLAAEWSYLNQPARLEGLGRRLIGLVPVTAAQQTDFAGLHQALEAPVPDSTPDARPTDGLRVDAAARTRD
jgi:hypothetical protein